MECLTSLEILKMFKSAVKNAPYNTDFICNHEFTYEGNLCKCKKCGLAFVTETKMFLNYQENYQGSDMMENVDLEKIIDNLHTNKISFEDYENYCKNIKLYSEYDKYVNLILALQMADVIYTTVEEVEKYCKYLKDLSNLVAEILRKELMRLNIDLEKYLITLDNLIEYNITFDKHSDYFPLFYLARFAEFDKDKCLKWADCLLKVEYLLNDAHYKDSYEPIRKFLMGCKLQLEDKIKGIEQLSLTRK